MGKLDKKVKSDRINALRKRYDDFLEEDKRRKERNDYILGRLDEMRFTNAVAQTKPQGLISNTRYNTPSQRFSTVNAHITVSNPAQTVVNYGYASLDKRKIVEELSKQFILIPKHSSDLYAILNEPCDVKNVTTDNADWKNKYEILDHLNNSKINARAENPNRQAPEKEYENIDNKLCEQVNENNTQLTENLKKYDYSRIESEKNRECNDVPTQEKTIIKEPVNDVIASSEDCFTDQNLNSDIRNENQIPQKSEEHKVAEESKYKKQETEENVMITDGTNQQLENYEYPIDPMQTDDFTPHDDVVLQDGVNINPEMFNTLQYSSITIDNEYTKNESLQPETEIGYPCHGDNIINQTYIESQYEDTAEVIDGFSEVVGDISNLQSAYYDNNQTDVSKNTVENESADSNKFEYQDISQINADDKLMDTTGKIDSTLFVDNNQAKLTKNKDVQPVLKLDSQVCETDTNNTINYTVEVNKVPDIHRDPNNPYTDLAVTDIHDSEQQQTEYHPDSEGYIEQNYDPTDYRQTENYDQLQYYYDNAQAPEINEHEETENRYDPAYEQQYNNTYVDEMHQYGTQEYPDQPSTEQSIPSNYENMNYESDLMDNQTNIEQVLDNEQGFVDDTAQNEATAPKFVNDPAHMPSRATVIETPKIADNAPTSAM